MRMVSGHIYTTFKYADLEITPPTMSTGQNVTLKATVTNTGSRVSDEVGSLALPLQH